MLWPVFGAHLCESMTLMTDLKVVRRLSKANPEEECCGPRGWLTWQREQGGKSEKSAGKGWGWVTEGPTVRT